MSCVSRLVCAVALVMTLAVCRVADGVIVEGVAAVVNGQPILMSELEKAVAPYRTEFAARYQGQELNERLRAAMWTLLNELIDQQLLLQEAQRLGLSVPTSAIDKGVEEVQSRFGSDEEFRDALAQAGDTETDVRDEVMRSLLLRKLMSTKRRQFEERVSVSEQEVQEYLSTADGADALAKQVELWQIWIAAPADASEQDRADARRRCEEILADLRDGADFAELARTVSEGPERSRGGLMGMVRHGEMEPALDAAAFSLSVGEISDVIESPTGYHILRVTRIEEPDPEDVADAHATAEQAVRAQKVQKKYEEWLAELRAKAEITVNLARAGKV